MQVIEGGKKPGRIETLAEEMFFVAPFPTHKAGAQRLSKRTKSDVSPGAFGAALTYVRENRERLGWTITYSKRGRNPDSRDRFRIALMERDGTFHTDDEYVDIRDGSVSTASATRTMADRLQSMLLAVAARTRSRNLARTLRGRADDLGFIARKLTEVDEAMREEDSNAA